jgi:2-keto-4-pentenoate hydratase/2-oxohepta-3-ene-1,7-dioic acid hydratase in catechol pathway
MQLISFKCDDRKGFGFLEPDVALDLSACTGLAGCTGWADALSEHSVEQLYALARSQGRRRPIGELALLPPITDADKILCLGLNFRVHARELGVPIPDKPALFTRVASSFVGHRESVLAPRVSQQFDYEGELAIVIGKRGRRISKEHALDYVLGYTVVAENSVRDWQTHSRQVTPGKNFFRSGAMGPSVVSRDEALDTNPFTIITRLNGTEVQNGTTADLIFPTAEVLEYISTFAMLIPGDVVCLGTPGGVGMGRKPPLWMRDGDVLEIEIPRVGTLRNRVVADFDTDTRGAETRGPDTLAQNA